MMSEQVKKRVPKPAISTVILTGFLGAGKTTLLNRLLLAEHLRDTAVIINEFGEIGIDHLLVERADEGLIELSAGCLCCTVRGDLMATMEDLLRRLDNGRLAYPFTRLIIETTGLADPAPVMQTILQHPYLRLRYRLDGVITVVDAINGMATLDAHPESVKQVAVADRIVITKSDLAGAQSEYMAALRTRLQGLAPTARLLDQAGGEATPDNLLDLGLWRADGRLPDVAAWLADDALSSPHDHGSGAVLDVNRHDISIRAFALTSDKPMSLPALDMFLDLLRAAHGPKLLRVKGIISTSDDPDAPFLLQGVQHVFHPPVRLAAWPDDDHRTRLVFIVRDLVKSDLQGLFNAFHDIPAIDQPDRAALTDNPLSLRR